jgi:hypothetical protein
LENSTDGTGVLAGHGTTFPAPRRATSRHDRSLASRRIDAGRGSMTAHESVMGVQVSLVSGLWPGSRCGALKSAVWDAGACSEFAPVCGRSVVRRIEEARGVEREIFTLFLPIIPLVLPTSEFRVAEALCQRGRRNAESSSWNCECRDSMVDGLQRTRGNRGLSPRPLHHAGGSGFLRTICRSRTSR